MPNWNRLLPPTAWMPVLTLALLFVASPSFAGQTKVEVCHFPPGNADNFQTITIGESAFSAHLAHGDLPGPCNALCASICDDGDACTVDDADDCELNGCPATREAVDCSDGLACTIDQCSPTNGCSSSPVVCGAPDLCTVSICAEPEGTCLDTPVVCSGGGTCDPQNGQCPSDSGPWMAGDVTTYSQNDWDQDPAVGGLLASHFETVYPALEVVVGIDGTPGVYSMVFRSAAAILPYLPATQPPPSGSPLNYDWTDPTNTTPVGVGPFGGEVLALRLNIDFSDAGFLPRVYAFGDLRICNYLPELDGLTIRDFMDQVNSALGGGPKIYDLDILDTITNEVNRAFPGGVASQFANDNLVAGLCP